MTRVVRPAEVRAVTALPAPKRYEYFVKRIVDSEAVWSLRTNEGWVMAGDETGHEVFPVWSDQVYAQLCAVGEWHDCEPATIPLDEWIENWLPGLESDQRALSVFPIQDGQVGAVVAPERLARDIQVEQDKY